MGKGTNTTTTTTAPNPQAGAAYSALLDRAAGVASTPYQGYSGELVAPINAQQFTGIGGINANAGFASPYIQQATQYANEAATPISGSQINQYLNPYTQDVIRATEAQFNQQNAQQQSQVTANAAAQGALGGDRVGVAQGTLAGQQQMAEAPVIAGLESQGYNTALQTALQEQQNQANAAFSLGNLGVSGQNAALQGAGAQFGAGSSEQQTQQLLDQALYQQFQNQLSFPYQQTQWLAGIDTGVGSQMGGTSSTTGPAPSMLGQLFGAGLTGAGIVGGTGGFGASGWLTSLLMSDERTKHNISRIGETKDGQPLYRYQYKGSPDWHIGLIAQDVEGRHPEAVHQVAGFGDTKFIDVKGATDEAAERRYGGLISGFDMGGGVEAGPEFGGGPLSSPKGFIPGIQITPGRGAPPPPGAHQDTTMSDAVKNAGNIAGLFKNKTAGVGGNNGDILLGGQALGLTQDYSGYAPGILVGNEALGLAESRGGAVPRIAGFGTGGFVRHFDDGGAADAAPPWWAQDLPTRPTNSLGTREIMDSAAPGFDYGYGSLRGDFERGQRQPALNASDYSFAERQQSPSALNSQGMLANPRAAFEAGQRIPYPTAGVAPGATQSDERDPRVLEVQRTLNLNGFGPLPQNGRLDDGTMLAMTDFAQKHRLPGGDLDTILGFLHTDKHPPGGAAGNQQAAPPLPEPVNIPSRPMPGVAASGPVPSMAGRPPAQVAGLGASPPASQSGPSAEFWAGLTAAGLGMMASRSPFPGVAIGEGGLKGLEVYSGAKKTAADIEDRRKQLDLAAKRVQQQVDYQNKHLQLQQEQLERGKYTPLPAMGVDPANPAGGMVAGTRVFNTTTGQSEFQPWTQTGKPGTGATQPSFDKATLTKMADQYLAGDKSVLVNLGRGAQGATDLVALRKRIAERMEEQGITPAQQAVHMAEFQGMTAGQRALGTRTAQIEMAANEARNMMPIALQAAQGVPRTHWVPINKLIERWQTGVESDPAQARFAAANFSLVNTYVRAIAPTGVPPESAREHALQMLSGAMSYESYKAVVDVMDQEMAAALHSPDQVMQKFRQLYGGQGGAGAHPAAPPAAPATAAPPGTAPPSGGPAPGFTGRTATNAQTGQKLRETTNGQWVP